MPLRLSELARLIPGSRLLGVADPVIEGVTSSSGEVETGFLFVAVRGFKMDGHQFIPDARERGAIALAGADEQLLQGVDGSLGRLVVPDDRRALAMAADAVYGHPSHAIKLVGVTGTNGKTTTVTLVAAILEAACIPCATLGTLGLTVHGKTVAGDRTTPEAPNIQRTILRLKGEGIGAVAMEVASHALDLDRTLGCAFDVGVFTNLTQDHLDYHPSMEAYFEAKKKLFMEYPDASPKPFTAVINGDDPYGARLAAEVSTPVITFGTGEGNTLRAEEIMVTPTSIRFTAHTGELTLPIMAPLGAYFNVYNTLGAVGVGLAFGISPESIQKGLQNVQPVAGRFEAVECGQPFTVIVDYAHSPDGLSNVLRSARAITRNRLQVVFGCGGTRDRGKRPLMGGIAAELADAVIVTSDNPRDENPAAIISEIVAGITAKSPLQVSVVEDRREAIQQALQNAEEGDVVVIAGKGHENYQIFADRTIHFDDRETVRELLQSLTLS
ncbi:MAG: UDP-N-acetylmuramoyl-L-alanyl-D-glutamate--2,6-diaminopimelate ligase [Armatimonadota bacterium]|nr:UDP-N-acetylmuramoyl-L-alanyl-D-glutamate--2,6-diaminopimelate ligase [Armatimonadota bacterium]